MKNFYFYLNVNQEVISVLKFNKTLIKERIQKNCNVKGDKEIEKQTDR